MSPYEQIARSLSELKGLSPPDTRGVRWLAERDVAVEVDFTAVDSLSCVFREARLVVERSTAPSFDELRGWANEICRRVTYLPECLALVETDRPAETVLVRSSPPGREPGGVAYYEVLVRQPGTLALRRFAQDADGTSRRPIDVELTQTILNRLIRDLAESIPVTEAESA
jgi:hypothetical protein